MENLLADLTEMAKIEELPTNSDTQALSSGLNLSILVSFPGGWPL